MRIRLFLLLCTTCCIATQVQAQQAAKNAASRVAQAGFEEPSRVS